MTVLSTLQDAYKREQIKQRHNAVDQALFEGMFDQMLKDRGLQASVVGKRAPASQRLTEVKKPELKQEYRKLKLEIPQEKLHHKMFHRYLP